MSELSSKERDDLPGRDFAYIDGKGGRHLPIGDGSHVRNAAARFDQTHFESREAKREAARHIVAAAKRHGVPLDDGDAVVKVAQK